MARKPTPVSTFTETNRDSLRNSAFHGANAAARTVDLLRTIGEKTFRQHEAELRDDYKAGHVAGTLFGKGVENLSADLLAKARAILAKKNHKAADGERRTKAEEDAVNAAKVTWSRILDRAGMSSSAPRSGNQNAKRTTSGDKAEETAKPASTPAASEEATPRAYSKGDVISHVTRQADTLWAFVQKNAKQCPIGVSQALAAFRAALKALDENGMVPAPAPAKPVDAKPVKDSGTASAAVTPKPYIAPPAPTSLPAPTVN